MSFRLPYDSTEKMLNPVVPDYFNQVVEEPSALRFTPIVIALVDGDNQLPIDPIEEEDNVPNVAFQLLSSLNLSKWCATRPEQDPVELPSIVPTERDFNAPYAEESHTSNSESLTSEAIHHFPGQL